MAEMHDSNKAPALKDNKKPGSKDDPVQVRPAGQESTADTHHEWDEVDEQVDESFPASDPPGNY